MPLYGLTRRASRQFQTSLRHMDTTGRSTSRTSSARDTQLTALLFGAPTFVDLATSLVYRLRIPLTALLAYGWNRNSEAYGTHGWPDGPPFTSLQIVWRTRISEKPTWFSSPAEHSNAKLPMLPPAVCPCLSALAPEPQSRNALIMPPSNAMFGLSLGLSKPAPLGPALS
jgi:hypothetical protein